MMLRYKLSSCFLQETDLKPLKPTGKLHSSQNSTFKCLKGLQKYPHYKLYFKVLQCVCMYVLVETLETLLLHFYYRLSSDFQEFQVLLPTRFDLKVVNVKISLFYGLII